MADDGSPGAGGPEDGDADLWARLGRYLADRVLDSWTAPVLSSVARSPGGLSWETFFVDAEDAAHPERRTRLVVKVAPRHGPLAPYDVALEAELLLRLASAGVPVPPLLAYEPDGAAVGRAFSVMAFVPGDIPGLRSIERWDRWQEPGRRRAAGEELMAVLGAVQRFSWSSGDRVSAVDGWGSATERVGRAVDGLMAGLDRHVYHRWPKVPVCRDAALWLQGRVPDCPEDELVVVHGDFRVGNMIWDGGRVAALLDWERSRLGDPMHDLGFFCMPMARQRHPQLMGMLLTFDEMAAAYQRSTGRPVDPERVLYYAIYWQLVEITNVLRGLAFTAASDDVTDLGSLTSFPLIALGTRQVVDLIEDYEAGRHVV